MNLVNVSNNNTTCSFFLNDKQHQILQNTLLSSNSFTMEHSNDDFPLPLYPLRPQGVSEQTEWAFGIFEYLRDAYIGVRRQQDVADARTLHLLQGMRRAARQFLDSFVRDCKELAYLTEMSPNQKLKLMIVLAGRADSILQEVENDLGL